MMGVSTMARRRTRKILPSTPFEVLIEGLTHDGRGIGRVDGKPVFIVGALPGERVNAIYTEIRRDYAEARVESLTQTVPSRVEPVCPSFGVCGGCSFQHVADVAQIELKQEMMAEQFRRIGRFDEIALFPPLTGPSWGYRHKARLGVKFVPLKGRVLVGFRERSSAFITDLHVCPVLHPRVGERLDDLSDLIGQLIIRDRVPQVEVAVGDHRAALVFRILEDIPPSDRDALAAFGQRFDFDIYIQRHGPDSIRAIHPAEPESLGYALPDQGLAFQFQPTDFTQVNTEINRKMVNRVIELLDPQPEDRILDLFAGIGNFTLPLAKRAGHVVGVEGSRQAVERAIHNATLNGLSNLECHIADLTQSLADCVWADQHYDKILLDPSRAGAEEVLSGVKRWGAKRIVYVSCNPSTLARDAGILVREHGYRLLGAGVMDMFPQTAHVESIALFEK